MDTTEAVRLLDELTSEASSLGPTTLSSEFVSWRHRVNSLLSRALGDNHRITLEFQDLHWEPRVFRAETEFTMRSRFFDSAMIDALGLLEAAGFELHLGEQALNEAVDHGFDPELWAFVQPDVIAEAWGKVVSQAGIFTEDRIRRWAGRPANEVGQALMTAVFGDTGTFRLGMTEAEQKAWHLLAMGMSGALRNPGGHRIINRPDHKAHAIGVLGVCSVLLTELRYEHGNRFVTVEVIERDEDATDL